MGKVDRREGVGRGDRNKLMTEGDVLPAQAVHFPPENEGNPVSGEKGNDPVFQPGGTGGLESAPFEATVPRSAQPSALENASRS